MGGRWASAAVAAVDVAVAGSEAAGHHDPLDDRHLLPHRDPLGGTLEPLLEAPASHCPCRDSDPVRVVERSHSCATKKFT